MPQSFSQRSPRPRARRIFALLDALANRYFGRIFALATAALAAWCTLALVRPGVGPAAWQEIKALMWGQALLWPFATLLWHNDSETAPVGSRAWKERVVPACLIAATLSFSLLVWRLGLAEHLGIHPKWWQVRRTFNTCCDSVTTSTS